MLAQVWNIGAIMLFIGTFWYWFGFKVDSQAEGYSWTRVVIRRDMFSLSLMATSVSVLGWNIYGGGTGVWFILVILATISLFGGVYWSKFSHMFLSLLLHIISELLKLMVQMRTCLMRQEMMCGNRTDIQWSF